jgi:hypothetical protein
MPDLVSNAVDHEAIFSLGGHFHFVVEREVGDRLADGGDR